MTTLVVDASALGALLFGEPEDAAVAERLAEADLHAPVLLPLEVASIAAKKTRRGELTREVALVAFARLPALAISLDPVDVAAVLSLALDTGLTPYDASYLWLARSLEVPLVTLDRQLRTLADGS